MTRFQLIVVGILIALVVIAVLLLSGIIPGIGIKGGGKPVPIVVWGTVPSDYLQNEINDLNDKNKNVFTLQYVEKSPASYEGELLNALASGSGPNLWLLPQDFIVKDKDKVLPIPFASFSERSFKDTFISEGELYLSKDPPTGQASGIIALPFFIDPIVLYWNRDLFSAAGIANPPRIWDDFVDFVQKLTVRDASGNITQAGAAFGEFQNIDHAEDIIYFLILQTGNPIVNPTTFKSELSGKILAEGAVNPAESAVRFFTEFSDPVKTTYSWNRSLPSAKNAFIGGILAMYFGYASEYKDIQAKNPHLNFDVAEIPQIKGSSIRATFARMAGLATAKSSANYDRAIAAAYALTGKDSINKISQAAFLPPVRRDLLAEIPRDPVLAVFYKSAIQSRAWLNPSPSEISNMFNAMIEDVIMGKKKISEAVRDAHFKLDAMLFDLTKQEKKAGEQNL